MSDRLTTKVGDVELKNPLIAAAAEHLIDADGVRRALAAGVGAVVVKSTNQAGRQGPAATRRIHGARRSLAAGAVGPQAPAARRSPAARVSRRSRSTRGSSRPSRSTEKRGQRRLRGREPDPGELDPAIDMARRIEQAGVRVLDSISARLMRARRAACVSTELDPARVTAIVAAVRAAIGFRCGSSSPARASACPSSRARRSTRARIRW